MLLVSCKIMPVFFNTSLTLFSWCWWCTCISVNRVINHLFLVQSLCFPEKRTYVLLKAEQKKKQPEGLLECRRPRQRQKHWLTLLNTDIYTSILSKKNSGNTPPCKLASAPCEISNQAMCGWSPQRGYHLRQSKMTLATSSTGWNPAVCCWCGGFICSTIDKTGSVFKERTQMLAICLVDFPLMHIKAQVFFH